MFYQQSKRKRHIFHFSFHLVDQSPVIVSFAEKSTPVWAIPFPAVTICPETKTYMDKLNFTETFNALKENLTANVSDDA